MRRPLCTCAGSSRECSQMELAPLLASVCTICREEMPSESPLSAGHRPQPAWLQSTKGPTVCLSLLRLHPVRPLTEVLFRTPGHVASMPRLREVKQAAQCYMAKLVSGRT